ncbi:metallophosphoesterase family protein [soil metagenome]
MLADIHGNLPALETVLAKVEALQPDQIVVDGDLINGVPFSAEIIDRVRALNCVTVRGNHEFYYLDFGTERGLQAYQDHQRWGQLHWLLERITPAQGAYLAMLPDERTFYIPTTQPMRVAHGVPGRNRVGFYNHQSPEKIIAEIVGIQEHTLISAHTHVQIDRQLRIDQSVLHTLRMNPALDQAQMAHLSDETLLHRHWHLINPGSVGLPLDGDPCAQFALLEDVPERVEPGGWRATMYRLPYDRRPALAAYAETGMLAAGGVITQLFYWELVTGEPEIILFYHWARDQGLDPDRDDLTSVFRAYTHESGREQVVRALDPLHNRKLA